MASLNIDLVGEQGSTFVLEFQIFDDLLNPIQLLSSRINSFGSTEYFLNKYRVRMKIKKSKYRSPELYSATTGQNFVIQPNDSIAYATSGIYFIGGTTGFMRMVMTSSTTEIFKSGRYFYDVELVENIDGYEVVSKLLEGKFEIDAEATK
jgi:hypothetical protein